MNKILSIVLIFSLLMSGICQQCVKAKAKAKESELVMSEDELLEVFFEVTNKWDHQYKMKVTIENISGTVIDDWEVHFDFQDQIEEIWNASIAEKEEGQNVVIRSETGTQDINIDGNVSFEIMVRYDGEIEFPEKCYLTREQCEVDEKNYEVEFIQNKKDVDHVKGSIKITNVGSERIEDWKFDFETSMVLNDIEQIWGAKLIDIDEGGEKGSYCQIDHVTSNQNIGPGQSIEFGFVAQCDGEIKIVENTLYSMIKAEYEEDDEDETIDFTNPYWEPRYDLDDFDTYEEYEEYCKEIMRKWIDWMLTFGTFCGNPLKSLAVLL